MTRVHITNKILVAVADALWSMELTPDKTVRNPNGLFALLPKYDRETVCNALRVLEEKEKILKVVIDRDPCGVNKEPIQQIRVNGLYYNYKAIIVERKAREWREGGRPWITIAISVAAFIFSVVTYFMNKT